MRRKHMRLSFVCGRHCQISIVIVHAIYTHYYSISAINDVACKYRYFWINSYIIYACTRHGIPGKRGTSISIYSQVYIDVDR